MDRDYWEKVGLAVIVAGGLAAFPGGVVEVDVQPDGTYEVRPATYVDYAHIDRTVRIDHPHASFEITILDHGSPSSATKLIFGPIDAA